MNKSICLRIAAILGFLAVVLGAFGAHGLEKLLEQNGRAATWQTAVEYHFYHTFAILFLALGKNISKGIVFSFLLGILIFSGSLYILSITNIKWLGAITPIGGVALIVGWLWLFMSTFKTSNVEA